MRITSVAIALLAGLTAACDGDSSVRITTSESGDASSGVLKVVDTLQCPQTFGSLTRKGTAQAGGAMCVYAGPRGAEVALHMVKLNGASVDETLRAFERRLANDLPEAAGRMAPPSPPAPPATPSSDAAPSPASEDRVDVRAPGINIQTQGENAQVRLPGLRVEAQGDKAQIRIGGLNIRADDKNATVNVTSRNSETVDIQAHDGAAQVRTRAPGAATRATYVLTDDRPSVAGWRLVGYEARGPAGGPIVVATVRSKDREREPVFDDARELVELNVGN
ncbi:MAG: methyltransferase type 11 [Brevundimonas sp.]|uniref:methyltransferase type 11 n=1 Tax=Brevundimonas sp. TaxID=1871086 RepID=UPI00121E2417|nr:methyltransferase type 11 [Brevundimonas sp.]RZJ17645.1 MAG: methyltransferase type 11 [Brevundimonas sp.]